MKKIKKTVVLLLLLSTALMAAFLGYAHVQRDTQPPVISCPDTVLEASISVTEEELLAQVSATDDRDGEVKAVVEKLSPLTVDNQRTITYAASDRSGNVSRATRTLHYTDYHLPRFSLGSAPRTDRNNGASDALRSIRATDAAGKNLTDRIRYHALDSKFYTDPGVHLVELRVTDSFGRNVALPVEIELYNQAEERIEVTLKNYLIYLPVGSAFEPESYFLESSEPGTLQVESGVNPAVPGTYSVVFTVTGENPDDIGRSRMIVVVE